MKSCKFNTLEKEKNSQVIWITVCPILLPYSIEIKDPAKCQILTLYRKQLVAAL